MSPIFLTFSQLLDIQQGQVERYGGDPGLRDHRLLESALAMPAAGIMGQYLHEDIHAMAAAYLFHIVQNHPFVDGNKRAGLEAALVFLEINGIAVTAESKGLLELTMSVAEGKTGKAEIAEFFRGNTTKG